VYLSSPAVSGISLESVYWKLCIDNCALTCDYGNVHTAVSLRDGFTVNRTAGIFRSAKAAY